MFSVGKARRLMGAVVSIALFASACAGQSRGTDAFCDVIRSYDSELAANVEGREGMEAFLGGLENLGVFRDMLNEMAEVAPAEVQADMEAVRDAYVDTMEAAGGSASDPMAAFASVFIISLLNDRSMKNVDTFTATNCGTTLFGGVAQETDYEEEFKEEDRDEAVQTTSTLDPGSDSQEESTTTTSMGPNPASPCPQGWPADGQPGYLARKTITDADLTSDDATCAVLTGADLINTNARGVSFRGVDANFMVVDGGDLSNADFWAAALQAAEFRTVSLDGTSFEFADMEQVMFGDVDLRTARFEGANLRGAYIWDSDLRGMDLTTWVPSDKGMTGKDPYCSGCDLRDAQLPRSGFRGVMKSSNLTGMNLSGYDFAGAYLEETIFDDANLQNANLSRTNLRGASFVDANIAGIDWTGALCPDETRADDNVTLSSGATCEGHL